MRNNKLTIIIIIIIICIQKSAFSAGTLPWDTE